MSTFGNKSEFPIMYVPQTEMTVSTEHTLLT